VESMTLLTLWPRVKRNLLRDIRQCIGLMGISRHVAKPPISRQGRGSNDREPGWSFWGGAASLYIGGLWVSCKLPSGV